MIDIMQNGIDIFRSGGPVMYPLGLLSVVALAIILERLWVLRSSNYLEPGNVQALSGLLGGRDFKAALDYCRRHPGPFTELVATMVENRTAPYDELKEILEDTGRRQLLGLQRGLPALATIVGGAPLLGLLGTVLGMIAIFKAVATGGTGITEQLATGISQALITTATGLIIAIPALFTHSYLEARAVGILADIEAQMTDFLHLVRRPEKDQAEEEED
ncbi:MAG: MotA/TolQ/ExbB proton channel family protein [Thermoanaerobaculales bacterium]|nr:MotA/TolQ/ExbB proton channel family protein [Thermoanaerobaculales bacterium]